MSQRQFDVLFTVAAHGPLSPAEVSRHLLLWPTQSQSALASLMKRRLVDRQYTGLGRGERVGYVLTAAGRWIVSLAESEEAPDHMVRGCQESPDTEIANAGGSI